jgi:hypothetical protein
MYRIPRSALVYHYKLRWVHFNTLDEYDDMRRCQLLMHTNWEAESHEDLIEQIRKNNNGLEVASICYTTLFDRPAPE